MKKALIYSILIHCAILLFLICDSLYSPSKQSPLISKPMLVDFVQVGPKSTAPRLGPNVKPTTEPKIKPTLPQISSQKAPSKEETPPLLPKVPPQKIEEAKKNAPIVEPKSMKKPVPTPPAPTKKEEPNPKTVIPLQKKEARIPPKKNIPQKEPHKAQINISPVKPSAPKSPVSKSSNPTRPSTASSTPDSLDDLLDDVVDDATDDTGIVADEVGAVVTGSEIDAVRRAIYRCWSVPAGAKGAHDLVVDIDLEMNSDGTVKKATIVDQARMKSDGFFKIAGESALRAALDPKCQPLPLPHDKYTEWKNITFSFNPKDMF